MKKNVPAFLLLSFLLLLFTQAAFSQMRRPAVPQPEQYLRLIKKQIAGKASSANARTFSCSTDSIVLRRQSQIDSFPITNPGCTVLRELRIYGGGASPAITNLDSLYSITEITSFFEIDSTSLTNLNGLSGLQRTAWLWLGRNPLLTNIKPPNLAHVGSVLLNDLPAFTSFAGFTQNLTHSRLGYLWLFNNIGITNFNGLQSLDSIDNFAVFGLQNLTSLQGLNNLVYSNDLGFHGCGNLTNVSALSGITELPYGSLKINYSNALTNWNGLQNITRIGGILEVQGSNVTSLSGLNPALVIENSSNPGSDSLRLEWNYQLSACSFPPICEYLGRSDAAIIHDNATGCNDASEIRASCGITSYCTTRNLRTWTAASNDNWNNAANWIPAGVPQACDSVVIPFGPTRPQMGSNAEIGALTIESSTGLFMNGYSLTVNGDVNGNDASISGGKALRILRSRSVYLGTSVLYVDTLDIRNFLGDIGLDYNSILPFSNAKSLVRMSDSTGRNGYAYSNGNYISGDWEVIINTTQPSSYTPIGQEDQVDGNVNVTVGISPNVRLGSSSSKLEIGGNLIITGLPDIDGIKFVNGGNSHISKSGAGTLNIAVLETAKDFGGQITLDCPVLITEDMKFSIGVVNTSYANMLTFAHNASVSQTSSASWVNGPIKKIGTSPLGSFKFPVGTATIQGAIEMSNPQLPTDEFTAEYFYENPSVAGYDTAQRQPSLVRVSGKEWWNFSRTGPSDVYLTLRYDGAHSATTATINDLRVARWVGGQWVNEGVSSVVGNATEAYVRSALPVTASGAFSLGYTPTRIPIITVGAIDSVGCRAQSFTVPFSVDTSMNNGNTFYAWLSDSTGSFANAINIGYAVGTGSGSILATMPGTNYPLGLGYRIRVTGSSPAVTSTNTPGLRLSRAPRGFAITGPNIICAGTANKYFASQKDDSATYTWSITPASVPMTAVADTATISPTAAGFFNLQLSATNVCATITSNYYGIQVLPPTPTAIPVLTKRGRWLDATKPLPAGASAYRWFRNDTLLNGATAPSYYASQGGSYTVRFANSCGEGPALAAQTFAAASLPQNITYTPITDKVFTDSSFTVNATASSGLPVEFQLVSGPGTIPGNVFNITGTGTVVLRAVQPGNDVYDTATHVLDTFVINKASQVITFDSLPDRIFPTTAVTLSASASSLLPVTYTIVSGPATISGNQLTITGTGTVTVRAAQAGNNNYLPATTVDRTFCVRVATLNGINGPASICPGIMATYTTRKVPGATYTWRLLNGTNFSSTNDTLRHTWPSPGNYTLIVSAAGHCGEASKPDTLTVTAITSAAPDSVRNMLPADGAVNQQLPLQLSWIPANPALYYTYDLYLWKATDPQPATPYRSNLTAVNFTLTLSSGLQFNTAYKWMVVAKNGSCTQINTGPVQQFSLIPLPDLQVYNVTAPTTAFSGQPVSVTWKVKNNGPGATLLGQRWTDAVFIAKDSVLDFTNPAGQLTFPIVPKLVATKPNVSALNSGEEYRDTATFNLPIDYNGPLYFHVITNYQPPSVNPVIETTLVNDTAHALPATAVALSPQPDFRIDTVVNPGNTFSGSTINVTFKVKNYGVTATGSWIDKIYLSKDAVFNPATALRMHYPNGGGAYFPQQPLDIISSNKSLQADSSYTVSINAVVPNFIFGQYYVYVITNATGSVYEGPNGQNNTNRGPLMQIFLTQTPQLVPGNITLPSVTTTAQTVAVGWDTKNLGAYDNIQKNLYPFGRQDTLRPWGLSQWYDRAFLSTDSTNFNVNSDLKIAETIHRQAIYPASIFGGGGTWNVPDNLPAGDYWVHVFANATRSVFEYPGLPQTTRSQKITVVKPDLSVPSVTVPATGSSGQPVSVNYTVQNSSGGEVSNRFRKDYFYLSTNAAFDGTAVLIDSAVYGTYTIPAAGSVALQKSVRLPNGINGARYLFVKANGAVSFSESTFANNTSSGAAINVSLTPPPDLMVTTVSLAPTVYTNTGFPFAYTVSNVGSGTASGAWKDSIFVSCSNTFNSGTAYCVAERTQQVFVPAGGSYTDSFNLKMPQTYLLSTAGCLNADGPQLYFFVKTNANSGLFESATGNNTGASLQRTVVNTLVDHVVTSVSAADTFYLGRLNKVAWTVKNLGLNPADGSYTGWFDGIYLSTDPVLSDDDRFITNKTEGPRLTQNASYKDSLNMYVNSVPAGSYYLLVKTNHLNTIPAERNTANNSNLRRDGNGTPLPVYVAAPLAPDLVDTVISAPSAIAAGQTLTVVYTVTNTGVGPTYGGWLDNIWLSGSFAPGGLLLGQKFSNRILQPGQSYTDSVTATIPLNFLQGNYVIVVHAAAGGGLFESSYTNNFAYRYLSVYTPAPVDLLVQNINVADTVLLGYPAAVAWRLRNNSSNTATGIETDGIYLSTDSTAANVNDVLIGTKENKLNILPLNDTALALQPVFSGVAEGSYYLKVRTDILRNILETNTGNNTALLNKKVFVKVKPLPIAVPTPDVLTTAYLYYKLTVPAALRGKTLRVKLTSNDSLTATNQLFIGLGYLPSAARFDYSHSTASGGNQSIILESAVDSVYYIAARSTKQGTQQISLEAIELPFALLVVNSNRGGNTGNVTVKLSGTLFSPTMTARLRGTAQNNTITAVNFYYVNGTTAYATFNLRGAPLGLYEVSLTKPDNSVALLANSFMVEATNSGGLLTGGTNTGQTGSGSQPGCDPGAAGGLNTQLQTELVIPPKVFADWPFVITINFTNTSNVDIPAQLRVLYSHDGAPLALTEAGLAAGKTSLPIDFKDAFGAPNVIRAGSSGSLKIYSKAPPSAGAHSFINFNLQ